MSTPNPLAPQGSLLEQQAKGRSTFHVISFIGAVHVMLLCGILWTACGRDEKAKIETPNTVGSTDPYATAPADPGAGAPPAGGLPPGASTNSPGLSANQPPLTGVALPPTGGTPGGGATSPLTPATPNLPPSNPGSTPLVPPATPDPVATAASPAGEYKVVKGDIGESIAKKQGVSLKALTTANPTINWSRLKVGQTIQIPAAAAPATPPETTTTSGTIIYTVKAGDTGTKIATKHGVKWAEIRKASHLSSDALHPGQKLTIPSRGFAAPAANHGTTPAVAPSGNAPQPSAVPVPRNPGQ